MSELYSVYTIGFHSLPRSIMMPSNNITAIFQLCVKLLVATLGAVVVPAYGQP